MVHLAGMFASEDFEEGLKAFLKNASPTSRALTLYRTQSL